MFFMQQMQYNAPNCIYVFQNFSGDDTPGPPFDAGTQNRAPLPSKILAARQLVVSTVAGCAAHTTVRVITGCRRHVRCASYHDNPSAFLVDRRSLWRNRLARSAVNRKVGGSNPPRDVIFNQCT